MARENACSLPHGPSYKTKREAEEATGGLVKRCGRCRQWVADTTSRRAKKQQGRS